MELDLIIEKILEHGILGIMLALSVYAIFKLLNYIKEINDKHENRVNELINSCKLEREDTNKSFHRELEKLEASHSQLIDLYKDLKMLIDKLFDKIK